MKCRIKNMNFYYFPKEFQFTLKNCKSCVYARGCGEKNKDDKYCEKYRKRG